MDLKKRMSEELASFLENLTLFEQARYLYIRTCQLFQYDFRYLYGDSETKNRIYNLPIDLHKMEDFRIICSTWCIIYQQLLDMIGIKSDILSAGKHKSVIFQVDEFELEADATCGADMTRVKMGHETRKYITRNECTFFKQLLTDTDTKLGYRKGMYMNECVELLAKDLRIKFKGQNISPYENSEFNYNTLLYKFNWVADLINMSTKISGYYDSNYYMSYLLPKLLTRWEWEKILYAPCYQVEGEKWDIMSLIKVEQEMSPLYLYLHDINGKYKITELEDEQRQHYVKNYSGINKHLFKDDN